MNKSKGDRSGSEFDELLVTSTDESILSSQNVTPPPGLNDFGGTKLQLTGVWKDGSRVR